MIAYLRLIRLPNVFTALADIVAGYFLTCRGEPDWLVFTALCVTSAALYLAGMAFNDIADIKEDARVRPTRPIPSGAVSMQGAVMCAGGLMLFGIQLAAWTGHTTLVVAAVLSASILTYDFVCKGRTFAGPIALGICRFSNILLGMSAAYNSPEALESLRTASIWGLPWLPAIASGLYGAGVTAFSAQEEDGKKTSALVLGWIFAGAGLIAAGLLFTNFRHSDFMGCWCLGLLTYTLAKPTLQLIRVGSPDAARSLVLAGVKGYCLLDAAMLFLSSKDNRLNIAALCAILLSFPGGWLRKWLAENEA
ncbi:MAG: UbiA family prenyltransferase [Planctomycetota bacterium]